MITTKLLEIRDAGTFIPALAIQLDVDGTDGEYLLRRAGYGLGQRAVVLVKLIGGDAASDPYKWPPGTRTMLIAHLVIAGHKHREIVEDRARSFDELSNGDVVDVEWLLGLTHAPKRSEQQEVG